MQSIYKNITGHLLTQDEPPVFLPQKEIYKRLKILTIEIDHNPLVFFNKIVGTDARLTRWALCLQQYNFKIIHKLGKRMGMRTG